MIYIASDHGGFELKEKVKAYLATHDFEVKDLGTDSPDSVDYPQFGAAAGYAVMEEPDNLGIICCGSGVGISIAANKVPGIRCVLANSVELATLGRQHNGANMLAMGERTHFVDDWQAIVDAFLTTDIDPSDRHQRRRDGLDSLAD